MKYCLFGLPGSGKGLYSKHIEKTTGAKQLSTGDLLRKLKEHDKSELGDEARSLGVTEFASDELIIKAIQKELQNEEYVNGVIFDGFPRTYSQATKMLEMGLLPDAVISIECSEKAILERIEGRRVHQPSGRVYHIKNAPPKVDGIDDITGEPLIIREDDKKEFMQKRFNDFQEKTAPALELLKSKCKNGKGPVFTTISGEIPPEEAFKDIDIALSSIKAIHLIRQKNTFTLISIPYDHNNKNNDDDILKKALHNTLMAGEIPFSSELFYYQKNLFNSNDENHKKIVSTISSKILAKFDKVVFLLKNENNKEQEFLEHNNLFISKDNLLLYKLAKELNKEISFMSVNDFKSDISLNTFDPDLQINKIDATKILNSISGSEKFSEILSNFNDFVIIESPYGNSEENEILKNINYARTAVVSCLNKGEIPFASHILYTQKGVLEDSKPEQRRLGVEAGLCFGNLCEKTILFPDLGMTSGMIEGVEKAKKSGRQVEISNENSNFHEIYLKAINKMQNKSKLKM